MEDEGFVPLTVPCRAPLDPLPYSSTDVENGPCFLCRYGIERSSGSTWEEQDSADVLQMLRSLIRECYGKVSDNEFTKIIHDFYEDAIRSTQPELPSWSRRSIYEHVVLHECDGGVEKPLTHAMGILGAQVGSLRDCCWECVDNEVRPNHRNLQLLDKLTRTMLDGLKLMKSVR